MTSQTYAKLCLDSRMHEAIEPQTRSEKNGVAMRFGITRRFGLRIPDSEAEEEAARREHRVGPPDAVGPLAAQQAPTPLRPGGGCSLGRSVIKPMVVIGNAVVPA